MGSALLVLSGTDASVLGEIATHFMTLSGGRPCIIFLSIFSTGLSVRVTLYHSQQVRPGRVFCKIAIGRELVGTIRRSMRNFSMENLSMNYITVSSSTARLCTTPMWTRICTSPRLTKNITLPMTLTGLFEADTKDILWMGLMPSRQLTARKDLQTSFGPAPESKSPSVCLTMFYMIPAPMWTL